MVDSLFVNGSKTPAQTIKYTLCLDTATKSWARHDNVSGESDYFNGTHLFKVAGGQCQVEPAPPGDDPTQSMPFTMILIDANATESGSSTVDGQAVSVWTNHRSYKKTGPFVQPSEDMSWFINDENQLVQGLCEIKVQKDYPRNTKAYHDYFSSGSYVANVPQSSFSPPAGTKCSPAPGEQPFVDAKCDPACAPGSKCCAQTAKDKGTCFSVTDCGQIHGAQMITPLWSFV